MLHGVAKKLKKKNSGLFASSHRHTHLLTYVSFSFVQQLGTGSVT